MLRFERRVVTALLSIDDTAQSRAVVAFADGALGAMPEILRFGITAISVFLTAWSAGRRLAGRDRTDAELLAWVQDHPIGLVRQWVRALRSLVLFAEQETMPTSVPATMDASP